MIALRNLPLCFVFFFGGVGGWKASLGLIWNSGMLSPEVSMGFWHDREDPKGGGGILGGTPPVQGMTTPPQHTPEKLGANASLRLSSSPPRRAVSSLI